MKEYCWNISGFFKEDANEVGREIEKLGDNITRDSIVELARDENSVLHNMFEWDDEKAGREYRRYQATTIICNLKVKVETNSEKPVVVRAFVTTKRDSKFEPIEKVIKDTDRYTILLDKAYKELNDIKVRYNNLIEIQDLLKDIPKA